MSSTLAGAEALAAEQGAARASWVFDGNTELGTYRKCVDLDNEGDPAWWDVFGPGEVAGLTSEALDAYLRAFHTTVMAMAVAAL